MISMHSKKDQQKKYYRKGRMKMKEEKKNVGKDVEIDLEKDGEKICGGMIAGQTENQNAAIGGRAMLKILEEGQSAIGFELQGKLDAAADSGWVKAEAIVENVEFVFKA